jgi:hypothetical protein
MKTDPEIYDVQREIEKAERERRPIADTGQRRTTPENDPLRSFERERPQKKTDLLLWMTFQKEDRIRKIRFFVKEQMDGQDPDMNTVYRDLNYIIWMESRHPLGDRDVAAVAFNNLFPQKKQ